MKHEFYVTAKDSYYQSMHYVLPVSAETKAEARSIFLDMHENRNLIPLHIETASELASRRQNESP